MDLIKAKRLAEEASTDAASHHQAMHADAKAKMIKATNAKIHMNDDGSPNPDGEKEIQKYKDAMEFHQTKFQELVNGQNSLDMEAQKSQIAQQDQMGNIQAQQAMSDKKFSDIINTHASTDPKVAIAMLKAKNMQHPQEGAPPQAE